MQKVTVGSHLSAQTIYWTNFKPFAKYEIFTFQIRKHKAQIKIFDVLPHCMELPFKYLIPNELEWSVNTMWVNIKRRFSSMFKNKHYICANMR